MPPLVIRTGVYPHRVEAATAWEAHALAEAGVDYSFVATASVADQMTFLKAADVILTSGHAWPGSVLAAAGRCQLLVSCGVGLDGLDVAAASKNRIMVCNMPDLCTDEVADHAMALLLACVRKVPRLHARVVAGIWDRTLLEPMPRLRGKTLGLLGFGRIGRAVGERAVGFGLNVQAHDPHVPDDVIRTTDATPVTLDRLLRTSDFLSCHLPLTEQTRRLLDATAFQAMRRSAIFINTSRGGIVNEADLIRALREGWLAAAGLDVLAEEPPHPDNPLLHLDNVIVTPHASGYSDEVVDLIPQLAVAEALAVIRGGTPRSIAWVNRDAWGMSGAPPGGVPDER